MARAGPHCRWCDAVWPPSARYCGRCGEPLAGVTPPRRPRRRIAPRIVVPGLVLLMAVGVAVAVGPAQDRDDGPTPGGLAVEVPAAEAPATGFQAPDVDCWPRDCERWRRSVGHGTTYALAGGLYHLSRHALVALDPASGAVRWRADLPVSDEDSSSGGRRLHAAGDQFVLLAGQGSLQARDAGTGAVWWQVPWPRDAAVVAAGVAADRMLITTSGALPDRAEAAGLPPGSLGLVALEAGSGEAAWATEVDGVIGLGSTVVVQSTPGSVAALDPASGAARWIEPALAAAADPRADAVVVADAEGLRIVDAVTGATRSRLPLDATADPTGLRLELHGPTLAVAAPAGAGRADRWDLGLYDLADGSELARYPTAEAWWLDDDRLFVAVVGTEGDVELVALDIAAGREVGRYGGHGWSAVGDGLLAANTSMPVPGGMRATSLAGPVGHVEFTRSVRIVSTEPVIVGYWDMLIRVDDRLLSVP